MWEGWKAGFMAFHAFHTLSFPWPTLRCGAGVEVAILPGTTIKTGVRLGFFQDYFDLAV